MKNRLIPVAFSLLIVFSPACQIHASAVDLGKIKLPPGFTIAVYAEFVPNARGRTLEETGGVFCSSRDKGPVRAVVVTESNPRGDNEDALARGVRNTVGFDWEPKSHELWFTDNGRD